MKILWKKNTEKEQNNTASSYMLIVSIFTYAMLADSHIVWEDRYVTLISTLIIFILSVYYWQSKITFK